MNTDVVEYSVTDAAIAKMEADYMGLTINGLNDKAGFAMVHSARMDVKNKRLAVEKRRKELKADALAWGKKVDGRANEIFSKLAPIEEHLDAEEGKITKEKARQEAEAKRIKEVQAQERVDQMASVGVSLAFLQAMEMNEDHFRQRLAVATEEYAREQARIADEKRKEAERLEAERKSREEESKRIASERAELERIRAEENAKRKEQEAILRAEREALEAKRREEEARARAERESIEAERRKVEDARREQEHREAVAKAEKEAAERSIRESKERAEREAREKAEAEAAAKAEAERQDRLRPDREKLQVWAASLLDVSCTTPESPEAKAIVTEARKRLVSLNRYIVNAAQEL